MSQMMFSFPHEEHCGPHKGSAGRRVLSSERGWGGAGRSGVVQPAPPLPAGAGFPVLHHRLPLVQVPLRVSRWPGSFSAQPVLGLRQPRGPPGLPLGPMAAERRLTAHPSIHGHFPSMLSDFSLEGLTPHRLVPLRAEDPPRNLPLDSKGPELVADACESQTPGRASRARADWHTSSPDPGDQGDGPSSSGRTRPSSHSIPTSRSVKDTATCH